MIASQFRQLRDFFRSQDFRHSLLITGGAFAALIVLAFAVGLIFPAVPAQVLTLFSQQMADAGVVSESGSISVPALLWNNLRAMVLSVLYGFIPFIYLPALSLGVNALLLGLFAAYFLNNGISILAYLGGILPHGIFELPALVISLACGIYLCSRINQYVRTHCGDSAPVSSLEIDAALTRPSLITLQEVEELSRLEPYGAGNNRPVFCLRGATLESVQGVGQNRHLKLKFQKSRVNFDGIFFSVTADECGVCAGMRVDAAFYLQVNEFRSQRSIQLQLIDLRPSLDPSGRENEALSLCRELISGGALSPRDAARALPSRDQFVRAWRILEREVGGSGVSAPMLPLLRKLSAEMVGLIQRGHYVQVHRLAHTAGLLGAVQHGDVLAGLCRARTFDH